MKSKIGNSKSAIGSRLEPQAASRKPQAFTLVELLVVITIIVILLALLAPALDKAVYAAELAVCGAKLKAVAGAVTVYAFENKRYYPDRGLGAMAPRSAVGFISPNDLTKQMNTYDIRPLHARFMDIRQMLQCPLVEPIELADTNPETNVSASYSMWWAWQYKTSDGNAATTGAGLDPITTHRGMFKVGDRFEWTEGAVTDSYNVLVGDYDLDLNPGVQSSHPDERGLMSHLAVENEFQAGANAHLSVSLWLRLASEGTSERGLIDMNHAFDDGAVGQYNDVIGRYVGWNNRDRRMGWVPQQFDNRQGWKRYQIPRD